MRPAPPTWRPPATDQAAPIIEAVEPGAAPAGGGARVVIRGRHLRPAQVMFGGAAARVTGATPGAVTVEVPPGGRGAVVIALTNDDGSWALAEQPFTYLD